MFFIGRNQERKNIVAALKEGVNVILKGKYGIGRTALVNQIIAMTQDQWRFIVLDFSLSPAQAEASALSSQASFRQPKRKFGTDKPGQRLIHHWNLEGKAGVIVLDNVAGLSSPKKAFIRRLNRLNRFHFIAIVEEFLPEKDLGLLRRELIPSQVITLRYLSVDNGEKMLRYFSEKYRFHWSENQIQMWASATHGYPLGLKEIVRRELERLGRR